MLGMRIIKNPENPKLYLIAQEYIDLADPDDIGNYRPEDLTEPQLQASILRLVESLKYNLRQFNSGQAYILPDIEEGNFVLTKDRDRLVYLDSGTYQSNEINAQKILYIARLAMLGGQTAEQIKADPFFKKTLENQELNNVPNHELYQVILAKENQLRINPDEIPTEIE
jgi:hypothetical protein